MSDTSNPAAVVTSRLVMYEYFIICDASEDGARTIRRLGVLSDDQVSEILAFFEREKHTKEQHAATLDVTWRVLGWRGGADLEALLDDADLAYLHQFLTVLETQPSLKRNATYIDRALYALYHHPLFETLYDVTAVGVVKEQIEFRLLRPVQD